MPLSVPLPASLTQALPTPGSTSQSGLSLHSHADRGREAVEQLVRTIYARRYGAHVPSFAPVLVSLQDGGAVLAAAGYRAAAAGPLFLEDYLSAPVETLIGKQTGVSLRREGIVEVGHLTAARSGEGRRLMQLLGLHLADQGFDWIVGTFTQELRVMLVRLGVAPLTLGAANPESLGGAAHVWGSYYEHEPLVLAIHLGRALRQHLARQMRAAKRGDQ
ncbi:MAG: hypothetical protein EOO29_02240 [Comamonadaceae bacterium]|nr:MAG: hypothetical protein EOO29_02240 [Comamonadaceae bacterium]